MNDSQLYGPRVEIFIREFVTNSGLFWIFDLLRVMTTEGATAYVTSLPHYVLLVVCLVQAGIMSRNAGRVCWWGNFIAPLLYSVVDLALERDVFFSEPNHLVYWVYAGSMALFYALRGHLPLVTALGEGIARTLLLPALYMITEWSTLQSTTLYAYWVLDPGHLFILSASIIFGVLLGISTLLSNRFECAIRSLASHLGQVSTWVFDPRLVEKSYHDASALSLQRVQRTILFMDIRGFTAWSERHTPNEMVGMLNQYYTLAECIIMANGGFKIQITGDEVMTRFATPVEGLSTACRLQHEIAALLAKYDLGAGIGLHTGDVIEGLVGGEQTRQYSIFGDSVNTAARLQSAAQKGEIVLSTATYQMLAQKPPTDEMKLIQAKGKSTPLEVYVIGLH